VGAGRDEGRGGDLDNSITLATAGTWLVGTQIARPSNTYHLTLPLAKGAGQDFYRLRTP
jgi:hypothetical protein